jgi:hypothetical protein
MIASGGDWNVVEDADELNWATDDLTFTYTVINEGDGITGGYLKGQEIITVPGEDADAILGTADQTIQNKKIWLAFDVDRDDADNADDKITVYVTIPAGAITNRAADLKVTAKANDTGIPE